MRLVQFTTKQGERRVAIASDEQKGALNIIADTSSVYQLARDALANETTLKELAAQRASGDMIDYDTVITVGRLLPPVDHPYDVAHCFVSGTGLTHLGSADARDQMHQSAGGEEKRTDAMKLFKLGTEQGKPKDGGLGVQPEWFYKGDGSCIVAPGKPFEIPDYALDCSEEAEIAGIYLIDEHGKPWRLGFVQGNEMSDHVMEHQNYLYRAHSKLRQCSFGPELLLGELPLNVQGTARLLRDGKVLWEKPFASGEQNMTHSIASLEHHLFKYPAFRRPGDVHVHFFGTAVLSYADDVKTREGDIFEISAQNFGKPLRNTLTAGPSSAELVIDSL